LLAVSAVRVFANEETSVAISPQACVNNGDTCSGSDTQGNGYTGNISNAGNIQVCHAAIPGTPGACGTSGTQNCTYTCDGTWTASGQPCSVGNSYPVAAPKINPS
jgi:hypothetical protein